MALSLTRGTHYLSSRLRDRSGAGPTDEWHYSLIAPLHRLRGRVFGVVGLGRIGTATALRAKALGMDVLWFDPFKPDGYDKATGTRRADSLAELLAASFVLSLHCPLTPQTRHLIDMAALSEMPRGSYLINTARGAIVDTAVLPAAIASGQLAGAGIDVLEAEPARDDDPLVRAWRDPGHPCYHRVIINPHSAFYSEEGLMDMRTTGAENCRRALLGEPIRNVVNA
jgi:D-3-phosphoglycerate dehydrogenase/C-terminal binding protein